MAATADNGRMRELAVVRIWKGRRLSIEHRIAFHAAVLPSCFMKTSFTVRQSCRPKQTYFSFSIFSGEILPPCGRCCERKIFSVFTEAWTIPLAEPSKGGAASPSKERQGKLGLCGKRVSPHDSPAGELGVHEQPFREKPPKGEVAAASAGATRSDARGMSARGSGCKHEKPRTHIKQE